MNNKRNGISVITLIISIIVIIILCTTIILNLLGDNNVIDSAKEARERSDIVQLTQRLTLATGNVSMKMALLGSDLKIDDTYKSYLKDEIKEIKILDNSIKDSLVVELNKRLFNISSLFDVTYLGLSSELNIENFYDNVASMKSDLNLKKDEIVSTMGYFSSGDGGSSIYKIVDANEPIDQKEKDLGIEGKIIELDNGLKAQLQIANKTVDVKQFGALGNGTTDESDLLQYIFELSSTDLVDKVTLSSGTYLVKKQIDLYSGEYQGKKNAKIKVEYLANDDSPYEWCIHNKNSWYNSYDDIKNKDSISIDNINFSYYWNTVSPNYSMKLIRFDYTTNSKITNCTFSTEEGNANGICALDMYTMNDNLTIDKCNFNLHSTNENSLVTAISIREYNSNLNDKGITEKIRISNCNIEKNGWDEAIWLNSWRGKLTDVIVDNCKIVDKGIAPTVLWVGASVNGQGESLSKAIDCSAAKDITIKNCTIDKYNLSYLVGNIGRRGNNGEEVGITDNVLLENNTINILSSDPNADKYIFINSYGTDKTSNIVYKGTTINVNDETTNFRVFYDTNKTVTCINTHINFESPYIVFYNVKEVDGVTSDKIIKGSIFRSVSDIKNVNVNIEPNNNMNYFFINDDNYNTNVINISNCTVKCSKFYHTNLNSNPKYPTINVTDSTIYCKWYLIDLYFTNLSENNNVSDGKITLNVNKSTLTRWCRLHTNLSGWSDIESQNQIRNTNSIITDKIDLIANNIEVVDFPN